MYEPRSALVSDAVYYDPQINQNASGSWREDIFFEGATQIQYVTKPLQNLTTALLEQLEPARELLRSPSGHTNKSVNTYEGTRYISVLASQARDRYYVYTGHGDSFGLQLDNGSGSARSGAARWFSPRDGAYDCGRSCRQQRDDHRLHPSFDWRRRLRLAAGARVLSEAAMFEL